MSPLRSGEYEHFYYAPSEIVDASNKYFQSFAGPSTVASSSPSPPLITAYPNLPAYDNRMNSVARSDDLNGLDQMAFLSELHDRDSSSPPATVATDALPPKEPSPADLPTGDKHITMPVVIEMIKNLAACKEKQFRWEQSVAKLASFPETDPNKNQLEEIISSMEKQKITNKEKAIYLYEQLAIKCAQFKNYIGAAKAYERAATLLFDISKPEVANEHEAEKKALATIGYLESAIQNYDAIHKYKHAGTLHYRCSCILRMIKWPLSQVEKHHIKALNYFTKPNHELKQRKRIDGLKISCYSSYSMARMTKLHNETDSFATTTTTRMNTIKFHSNESYHLESDESDDSNQDASPMSTPTEEINEDSPKDKYYKNYSFAEENYYNDKSNGSDDLSNGNLRYTVMDRQLGEAKAQRRNHHKQQPKKDYAHRRRSSTGHRLPSSSASMFASFSHKQSHHSHGHHHHQHKSASASFNMSNSTVALKNAQRCIEDRIESARKLVKKLQKVCPFYEVSLSGEDAGRVYCHICCRFLGAVSSTLKNHVNTQEHRQAYEDRQDASMAASSSSFSMFPQQTMLPSATNNNSPVLQSVNSGKLSQYNGTITNSNNNGTSTFMPTTQYQQVMAQPLTNKPNNVLPPTGLMKSTTNNSFMSYEGVNENESTMLMTTSGNNSNNNTDEVFQPNGPNWNASQQGQISFDSNQIATRSDEQLFQFLK